MVQKIIFSYPDNEKITTDILKQIDARNGEVIFRHFPDKESFVRILTDVADKEVILVCSLNDPDTKILPIVFFAQTARGLGAKKVGLVSPYLAYMRQDKAFNTGECVSSRIFSQLISEYFDWLVTVDPHLHRHGSLDEIYSIPATVEHATSAIASWIKTSVENPVLIGPDEESLQWVSAVAGLADAPYLILQKNRLGDRSVRITVPDVEEYLGHTPVLVDDIISTAHTMIETVKHLHQADMKPPVCIGVHAVFAENAFDALTQSNVSRIVTCNTIKHKSNSIDVSSMLARAITKL